MSVNKRLHALLDEQIEEGSRLLHLSHDEIDEWRAQFEVVIPVGVLSYRGIPITEDPRPAPDWSAHSVSVTGEKTCDCGHPESMHRESQCHYNRRAVHCACSSMTIVGLARNALYRKVD